MLTRPGRIFAAITASCLVLGWVFGYRPLVAVGCAFFVVLLVALFWVLRKPSVEASRIVEPERVRVGSEATSTLTITNRGRRRTNGGVALEQFGLRLLPVTLPSLSGNGVGEVTHELPTNRRGVYAVGPLLVDRSDPFGFVRTGQRRTGNAVLYVHPLVHTLDPFPSGLNRDLDGPSFGEAPEGGITFHNLREYVEGDDLRLVHWRSFARTGEMMVRHNVDTYQPRTLVILDTRSTIHDADSFDAAVSAAASIVEANMAKRFPFSLKTTCGRTLDHLMSRTRVLDELAAINMSSGGSIADVVEQARRGQGGVSLAVISGRCSAEDLSVLGPLRNKFAAITIGRLGAKGHGGLTRLPGAVLINAEESHDFARSWNQRVRR